MPPRKSSLPPAGLMPGMTRRTEPPEGWFVAKVTAVASGEYEFDEWHLVGDGTWEVKTGGRVATDKNPGVPVTGVTFAVGDFALVRTAPGAGGMLWEMMSTGGTAREITYVSSVCPTFTGDNITGITVEKKTVTVMTTSTIGDPVCTDDPTGCCETSWNCVAHVCTEIEGDGGTYADEAACLAADCEVTYDCVDSVCTEVAGAGGEYGDLAACIAAECEPPIDVPCSASDVPSVLYATFTADGPNACLNGVTITLRHYSGVNFGTTGGGYWYGSLDNACVDCCVHVYAYCATSAETDQMTVNWGKFADDETICREPFTGGGTAYSFTSGPFYLTTGTLTGRSGVCAAGGAGTGNLEVEITETAP